MRRLITLLLGLCFVAASLHAREVPAADISEKPEGLPFELIDDAWDRATLERKVMVVEFTAAWCGWCRKMKHTTWADPAVMIFRERFTWARVDVDAQPDVAASFNASGLPALAFVNRRGEILRYVHGYQPPELLAGLLAELVDQVDATGEARGVYNELQAAFDAIKAAAPGESMYAAMDGLLAAMRKLDERSHEAARRRAVKAILAAGERGHTVLITMLRSDRLGTRAAAYGLLQRCFVERFKDGALPYDAFASFVNILHDVNIRATGHGD